MLIPPTLAVSPHQKTMFKRLLFPFAIQIPAGLISNDFAVLGSATTDVKGTLQYDDAQAVGQTQRFYRIAYP